VIKNGICRAIMRDIELFQLALGLSSPWQVSSSEFDLEQKRLDIKIDFPRGSLFSCPECNQAELKAGSLEKFVGRFQYV
jgi:hypothetical protein